MSDMTVTCYMTIIDQISRESPLTLAFPLVEELLCRLVLLWWDDMAQKFSSRKYM